MTGSRNSNYGLRIAAAVVAACAFIALTLYGRPSVAAPQSADAAQSAYAAQPADAARSEESGRLTTEPSSAPDSQPTRWREAEAGYQYAFPRDHSSHDEYGIEWWYYTGNLQTRAGRRFGYQLTFFRVGVDRKSVNPSRWAVRDLYIAHFAISDIDRESFHSFERINRAAIGWAGADSASYRVWNDDWVARLDEQAHVLNAKDEDYELSLRLDPAKPEAIHGENGISKKGAAGGNASHYYSLTRLKTSGSLMIGGESFEVDGLSWMDHEFGTSFLEVEQAGWDWFSIQLEDGRDLMVFQIRRSDGSIDPHSSGTLIEADGRTTHIPRDELKLIPGEAWRSAASGASYPARWTIELPRYGLRLIVRPAFNDQELRTTESTGVTYWEGSVVIEGSSADQPVRGRGYLEMTGYAGASMGQMMRYR
ncbi:MAG TPA: lipocalin-like domain-containing protein [Blastocatellia bacterium]|nr:lipocalin-like domain-containing protein [Blastocatellia bacterium]